MLMLLFYSGEDRFACTCEHIVEIIPPIKLKPIHHMPEYVSGSIIYGGKPLPIIDWCQMIRGTPCHFSFHTRMILFRISAQDKIYEFGMMAEMVTKTMNVPKEAFVGSGVFIKEAPFLGGVLTDERGSIQFVEVEKLLDSIQTVICGIA
ncbi:MAG: hypothetical protein K940chlam3_00718 [Chlamydiae bacterium]|nr:hypothetical protein [Chlamydiota bacterium]